MSELPAGWRNIQIGELCELANGRAFRPEEWDKVGLPIIRIQNLNRPNAEFNYFNGELSSRHLVMPGHLLFAWSGTPGTSFGAHVWKGPKAALNQHIFKVDFDSNHVDKTFLRHAINQKLDELIGSAQGGVGLRHVTKGTFEQTLISLPPRAEQGRIAQKLDELLAQVDTLRARIDAIPALLNLFRESVLRAAVSGRLTKDWRAAHADKTSQFMLAKFEPLPPPPRYKSRSEAYIHGVCATSVGKPSAKLVDAWEWVPLVQVARMESGHTPSREVSEYWGGDFPWIGIKDARINHEKTIYSTQQHTNQLGLDNSAARLLPEGTVCISRTASVGYVVKMGVSMATSQDFVNWVPSPCVHSEWLKWLFVAEKESLFRFGKGTTHTTIYFPEWLSLHVALPHVDEQVEIAARVQGLLDLADNLVGRVVAAKQRIDTLTQSILSKAFRGELVPQDPKDEPASVLLERIRAQRANAPKPKGGRTRA